MAAGMVTEPEEHAQPSEQVTGHAAHPCAVALINLGHRGTAVAIPCQHLAFLGSQEEALVTPGHSRWNTWAFVDTELFFRKEPV